MRTLTVLVATLFFCILDAAELFNNAIFKKCVKMNKEIKEFSVAKRTVASCIMNLDSNEELNAFLMNSLLGLPQQRDIFAIKLLNFLLRKSSKVVSITIDSSADLRSLAFVMRSPNPVTNTVKDYILYLCIVAVDDSVIVETIDSFVKYLKRLKITFRPSIDNIKTLEKLSKSNLNLMKLKLSDGWFGVEECAAVCEIIETNTLLTKVDLSKNRITDLCAIQISKEAFKKDRKFNLILCDNRIGQLGAFYLFTSINKLKDVAIDLSGNYIHSLQVFKNIIRTKKPKSKLFDISRNYVLKDVKVEEYSIKTGKEIKGHDRVLHQFLLNCLDLNGKYGKLLPSSIDNLSLSGKNIRDDRFKLLVPILISNIRSIKVLDVSFNNLTDDCFAAMTKLLRSIRIDSINLSGNYFSDRSIAWFISSLCEEDIKEINISNSSIGAHTITMLLGLIQEGVQLERIIMRHSRLTDLIFAKMKDFALFECPALELDGNFLTKKSQALLDIFNTNGIQITSTDNLFSNSDTK